MRAKLPADCPKPRTGLSDPRDNFSAPPQTPRWSIGCEAGEKSHFAPSVALLARHLLKLSHPPVVIFTTAFHQHALAAFEVHAVDYLVKPVRVQRLLAALQKVPRLKPMTIEKLTQLPAAARRFLSVTERSRVVLVPVDEVIYLKAELKYITIRTAQREYLLEESLTRLDGSTLIATRRRMSSCSAR